IATFAPVVTLSFEVYAVNDRLGVNDGPTSERYSRMWPSPVVVEVTMSAMPSPFRSPVAIFRPDLYAAPSGTKPAIFVGVLAAVAVAAADKVRVVPLLIAAIVVPEGIFAPTTDWPIVKPTVLATLAVLLFLVVVKFTDVPPSKN